MSARNRAAAGDAGDRQLRLLPPRLVPLSAEQERQAVDALAVLLAGLLARQEGAEGHSGKPGRGAATAVPNDDEAA